MEAIPASVWMQYPVALILLIAVLIILREFKAFLKEQNKSWQDFLQAQKNDDQKSSDNYQAAIRDLAGQVKNLAQELVNLRSDFDKAVTLMRERTASRVKYQSRQQ